MTDAPERIWVAPWREGDWSEGDWDDNEGKTLNEKPCIQYVQADRIEALEAKLAKAVEGLHAVVQHEASTFFGPDGEKNKRASWRGVMRKVRATLATIKGKSHD